MSTLDQDRPFSLKSILLIVSGLSIIALIFFVVQAVRTFEPADVFENKVVQKFVESQIPGSQTLFSLMPEFAGLAEPKKYLLLFQNNTEMRPSGGFIGVYGVITVDKGRPEVHVLEGTEVLDERAPESWRPEPPAPIKQFLGVDRWYVRDGNWSPDFSVSAQQILTLYKGEGGLLADDIDIVVAVTPTVIEELLKITGPLTVDGITFDAESIVETLQYEVHYGFADRGEQVIDRKAIVTRLSEAFVERVLDHIVEKRGEYMAVINDMITQKHILFYSTESSLQEKFVEADFAGLVKSSPGDYLLWTDANLAALKTDYAMVRLLNYQIEKNDQGRYQATAEMTYNHTGTFDWRTTRYLSYVKLYVPPTSEFVSLGGSLAERAQTQQEFALGRDLGKQWFGTYVRIEPGQTETLSFTYLLPSYISRQIDEGRYDLFVQKQAGLLEPGLTLDLDFGTTIKAANPAEAQDDWNDMRYQFQTRLPHDMTFSVALD